MDLSLSMVLGGQQLVDGAPPAPTDVILTLSGGGLGAAPTIYGGNLRGGAAGTQIQIGAGTPWSHTGGAGAPDYVSDGRGGTWMDAGGTAAGDERGSLYCVFPRSQRVGFFLKQSIKQGGIFNGAGAPNTVGVASSHKPMWLKDGDSGGNAGFADLVVNTHNGNGACLLAGNSCQFGISSNISSPSYFDMFNFDGPTTTFGVVDLATSKAAATASWTYCGARTALHEMLAVGGDTSSDTPAVRSFDRFQLNGFGLSGDLLIGAAYVLADGDHNIAILAGNKPHLDQCTDLEFVKPTAWVDGQITLAASDIPAGFTHVFIRDRAGNWFNAPATGGALVAGRGIKVPYVLPAISTLTSYVKVTTSDSRVRRDFTTPWTVPQGQTYEMEFVIRVGDMTTNKYLCGGTAAGQDNVNITTAGNVRVRLGADADVTVGSAIGIIVPGTKGVLKVSWASGTASASWTPQGGSTTVIGSTALVQTRSVSIGAVLRSSTTYPANVDVYAIVMRDLVDTNNVVALMFRTPIDGRASKPVFDINGVKAADAGGGSSYQAIGTATPSILGVWAQD